MVIVAVIFWLAIILVGYTYVGYPGLIAVMAWLRPRTIQRGTIRPTVTLLIVAYNEASRLVPKLENCLALAYPKDRLEIVLASDGSTDSTAEIAQRYESRGIAVLAFEARRGKPSVLDDVVPRCRGEIMVLSDVRQMYDPHALVALVENFHDPAVGAVSGELMLRDSATAVGGGVGFYWRYEKFIRRNESRFDSTVGATGAIYAIRRDLFTPIPADTFLDDVLIPLWIMHRGYRVIFEPEAKAFDQAAETSGEEFTRKVRTIAGNLQLFARERWLWRPSENRLWFQAVSHKLLRIGGPFLLGAIFVANALLGCFSPVYQLAFAGQLCFYGAALGGFLFGHLPRVGRWLSIPYAFCLLNYTTLISVIYFLSGIQKVTWQKASDLSADNALAERNETSKG
jgi:cellulose synthase/poly-beta-1,6-N-acetylglucosamine synthase-like glycosyltransferase